MNILGRIAYFFSVLAGYFVQCWHWAIDTINNNMLLKELFSILGYVIIALIAFALIRWLVDHFLGD